ncbi:tetratricopeptide repeat protein [Defluviimonas sp. WL0024]|uniref:Tetratricopeptide repeat protein n=1 Tax=Albidovulum salinarum TaxID=2984153 RepID=A0ABT2WYW9_9RHOB|nr:tetratricopeptide repeat protein [Defluviimonas sp. WL0024]MCU9846620.1 tetratricopeptide repeat protein [Defluviimonas sp. WL0024]
MSETDSFIDEVTEEVRRDKLFALMRKYGWIGIALVVLIVGGAGYTEWQKARHKTAAQGFGDSIVAALESDDAAARLAALETIGADGVGDGAGQRAIVTLLAAHEALRSGDRDGARDRFEALAADPEVSAGYRNLARLKAVILAGAEMDAAERDAALEELAQPGAPFRVLALEQQALVLMADAKDDEALELLRRILEEPDVTAGLRRRVTQLIVILGGDPEAA